MDATQLAMVIDAHPSGADTAIMGDDRVPGNGKVGIRAFECPVRGLGLNE